MESSKKKLAERVLKLFTLGEAGRNNSEAEAMAAVTKAREMMLQYNLTLADIEAVGTAKAKKVAIQIVQAPCYTLKQRFAVYDDYVAAAVEQITDTRSMTQNKWQGHQRYWQRVFIGTEMDVAVAGELFLVLLDSMRQHARRRFGKGWSKKHTSYSLGFSAQIYQRSKVDHMLTLPPGDAETVALVLRDKKKATDEWMDKHTVKGKVRKVDLDFMAHEAGRADGSLVDLGDPARRMK